MAKDMTAVYGPVSSTTRFDPLTINQRLYHQISELLHQLEDNPDIDVKTRYMALMAIARMQAVFVALRKEKIDEPNRGSAVRKYAGAFKTNGASGRKAITRQPEPEPDDDNTSLDSIIDGSDDDAIA